MCLYDDNALVWIKEEVDLPWVKEEPDPGCEGSGVVELQPLADEEQDVKNISVVKSDVDAVIPDVPDFYVFNQEALLAAKEEGDAVPHIKQEQEESCLPAIVVPPTEDVDPLLLSPKDYFNEAKFLCRYCKTGFTSPLYLQAHVGGCRKKDRAYETDDSDEAETAASTLTIFPCNHCNSGFTSLAIQKRHIIRCMKKIKAKTAISKGLSSYSATQAVGSGNQKDAGGGPSMMQDKVCNTTFEVCGRESNSKSQCQFQCVECSYKCRQKGHLMLHIKTIHRKEKAFACTECEFTCGNSDNMKIHMLIHTGVKPFTCLECDFTCWESGNMTTHMRTHTGEKPYACTECSYRTTTSSHLKTHMRSHTGEKPFACTECSYRTTQSSHLKRHMKSHTGEKPYGFNKCSFKKGDRRALNSHTKSHDK